MAKVETSERAEKAGEQKVTPGIRPLPGAAPERLLGVGSFVGVAVILDASTSRMGSSPR